jgi:hypothetical protein
MDVASQLFISIGSSKGLDRQNTEPNLHVVTGIRSNLSIFRKWKSGDFDLLKPLNANLRGFFRCEC